MASSQAQARMEGSGVWKEYGSHTGILNNEAVDVYSLSILPRFLSDSARPVTTAWQRWWWCLRVGLGSISRN